MQTAQILDQDVFAILGNGTDNQETGEIHHRITCYIVEGVGISGCLKGEQTQKDKTGMGDTGKTQHTFKVFLDKCRQVAIEHGENRADLEQADNGLTVSADHACQPDKQGDSRKLRYGSDKGCGFIGGSFIDIRDPEMEGKNRQFVKKAGNDHHHRDDGNRLIVHGREPFDDHIQDVWSR